MLQLFCQVVDVALFARYTGLEPVDLACCLPAAAPCLSSFFDDATDLDVTAEGNVKLTLRLSVSPRLVTNLLTKKTPRVLPLQCLNRHVHM